MPDQNNGWTLTLSNGTAIVIRPSRVSISISGTISFYDSESGSLPFSVHPWPDWIRLEPTNLPALSHSEV